MKTKADDLIVGFFIALNPNQIFLSYSSKLDARQIDILVLDTLNTYRIGAVNFTTLTRK